MRTNQGLPEDAAGHSPFHERVYTRRTRCRSIPCLRLIKQTRLIGVLYLENNLAPHMFAPARIAVLDLLASQAAISLRTVRLYADLRHTEAYLEVAQRLSHTSSFGWHVSRSEIFWSDETFGIVAFDRGTRPTLERSLARVYPDRTSLGGNDWELEHRLLMPDGSVQNLHVVGRAMLDDAGEVEFVARSWTSPIASAPTPCATPRPISRGFRG
jgi:hypothetical protein